ncbi:MULTISPECIES: hypothetical protein [unclassified Streptomyces]|uniref:hypothetical protein n=1 Tax=unclassified Streptomyces TaxID=2593676 RepID=UPI00224D524F|nr:MULTISPECIES: hypothetical protein [unclassified Streptomyces]MCX5139360.1 hypothetical protein [Streptomyces sp. NBC_00338]WSU58003.1 hypothetical protein OG450_09135 [Streptomyces sp. NBC_01104]
MRGTRHRTRSLLAASAAVAGLLVPVGLYAAGHVGAVGAAAPPASDPEPSGAECRTAVKGSRVVAYCHNPYPSADRVQLHTECARWWDVDADSKPVAVGPGRTVRLDDRCWKEVSSAWVTHARETHDEETGKKDEAES